MTKKDLLYFTCIDVVNVERSYEITDLWLTSNVYKRTKYSKYILSEWFISVIHISWDKFIKNWVTSIIKHLIIKEQKENNF